MLKKIICDNSILIVPSSIKEKIIEEISSFDSFFSCKVISDIELKKNICFDYGIEAIDILSSMLNINHYVAKEYIEAMYYINDSNYNSEKLNKLYSLKKELLFKNLLKTNDSFYKILKDKKIIVYGFDTISKEFLLLLNKLPSKYQIVDIKEKTIHPHFVYHYEYLEEEVDGVCYQISDLLLNGIDINKIKLANVSNDYLFTIKRYFNMYNLPINLDGNTSLYSLLCVKDFYNNFIKNNDLSESLNYFKNTYPKENEIYSSLVNVCNKLVSIENKSNSLLYLLKETKAKSKKLNNAIEVISLNNYAIDEDEYIFILSVNQGIYPKTFKDEDILSDKEKEELLIDTSEDKNILSKKSFALLLSKSDKLILSYKDKSAFASFNKAFILNELNIEEKFFNKNRLRSYSQIVDKLSLAQNLDKIYQKNEDFNLEVLYSNYDINYKTFSHRFKSFDSSIIKNYLIDRKKNLSYSALDNYFKCSFRYYLYNILSIGDVSSSGSIDIGNVFHKTLELSFKSDFDFEQTFNDELNKIDDVVTRFYLNKHKLALKEIIKINKENLEKSHLKDVLTEHEVSVKYSYPIEIKFRAFMDKVLYTVKDGITYVAIIDYKTGDPEINVSKVKYGLSMQLPIYLYLIKHTPELKNVVVCGFYLQKLIPKQPTAGLDYFDTLKDSVALQGYSNSSLSVLSMLDPGYENSTMIKSMRIKKDGNFYSTSKVLSSEEMEDIADLVEEKVKDALEKICNCEFDINPKVLDGKNVGCKYCEFADCCFFTHNDLMYLDNKKLEEESEMVGE